MSVHNLYKAVCTVFKDQINFSSTRIPRCWSHPNTDDWLHFPLPLLLLPFVPTCNVPTYYVTMYDSKPILPPFDSVHNYMIMCTLITNYGREEATSSQIQGSRPTFSLWHHSHLIAHYTNPGPHMVLVSGWGAKPVFCLQHVFF